MSNDQKDRATFSYEADFGAIIGIDTSTKQGAELQVYITKLLSTARAEERAKVMKEVSETPAVAKVVSSGPLANLQCLEWVSANASLSTTMGDELIVRPTFKE